jgi:hypothetical protein
MKQKSTIFYWVIVLICLIVILVGVYQLGNIIGSALYSSSFSFESISIWQIGLIGSGVCGVFEFIRTIKKLKVSQQYN